jgi:hypothetical protein
VTACKQASLVLSVAPFEAELGEILFQTQKRRRFFLTHIKKEENIRHFKQFLQVFRQRKCPPPPQKREIT